jgi:hypothetical protein
MRLWKKRAMALLELMRQLDPDGRGLSLPELRRVTSESRPILLNAVLWLQECGAAECRLDAEKRKRWTALSEEPASDEPVADPLPDLGLDVGVDLLAELLIGSE